MTDEISAAIERLETNLLTDSEREVLDYHRQVAPMFERNAKRDGQELGPTLLGITEKLLLSLVKPAIAQEGEDWRLNYDGAIADLESMLDVLVRRINGEKDLASAAEWVRLNYPLVPESKLVPRSSPPDAWRPTHRHVGRGTDYQVVGEGWLQTAGIIGTMADDENVTIYCGENGQLWVRPTDEFNDGRFDVIPPPPSTKGGVE